MILASSAGTSDAVSGRPGKVDGSHAAVVPGNWYGSEGGGRGLAITRPPVPR